MVTQNGDSEISHRQKFTYEPVNKEPVQIKPHTPAPHSDAPGIAETTSLAPAIPMANLDVEHGSPSKPPAPYRYGSFLSDSDSASSFIKAEHPQPPRIPWLSESSSIHGRFQYWSYYIPCLTWMPQYRSEWLRGDIVGAVTVASLYIPMCFSFAILGKVDPISGLYAFIIHPFIYALLGSCPQMVVGPEATGSLMVGAIVNQIATANVNAESVNDWSNAQISGVATSIAGAMLLSAGLGRIGFVDSVLNRPFMQGFLSGVGFVLVIEQALPELGLYQLARDAGVNHSSAMVKLGFILSNLGSVHALTAAMSLSCLALILIFRTTQRRIRSTVSWIVLIPDRLIIVTVTAFLTWKFGLAEKGLEILGALGTSGPNIPTPRWPLQSLEEVETVFSTSFLMALLGFFESSVTAKSIRPEKDGLQSTSLSANRELIALGTANIVGGCFTTLPAFGGFGRSKLLVQSGGTTPMSSIILSSISLMCVLFVLPALYYVPKPVLSAMASVVGISMMEECPHDIKFFFKVRGWNEVFLMACVFLSTACYSMSLGVAVGMVITLYQLVRHSTRSRVRILGRVPGTKNTFEDAELAPDGDQFERCLIVRVPEPLTFANVGDLRTRLSRFERYGAHAAHPSLPRIRADDRCLIFDVQGLTEIDPCGIQILTEMVQEYADGGTQIVFCRLRPTQVLQDFQRAGIVSICGGMRYFVNSVEDALRLVGLDAAL